MTSTSSHSQQDKDIAFYPKTRGQPALESTLATAESQRANARKIRKPYTPVLERRFSDRVHSDTAASKAKCAARHSDKDKRREMQPSLSARDPLPAKAVSTKLSKNWDTYIYKDVISYLVHLRILVYLISHHLGGCVQRI